MIKFKKSFTIVIFIAIIIISITISTINNANAIATVTAEKCFWCCSGQNPGFYPISCPNNNGTVTYLQGVYEEKIGPVSCCCRQTTFTGSCFCGVDGKTYCPDATVMYGNPIIGNPPTVTATCSAGPDGKTYCLVSGSASYPSGVSACYNQSNCIASTPPAAATCSTGPDGKTYCLASGSATYPSGISACYNQTNCITGPIPPIFTLSNGTNCNGSACVCNTATCTCSNGAIQNCATVGTPSTCTPDSSNSCNLQLNASSSNSTCVGVGCANNNGFFSCTQSSCLISNSTTTCTGTTCSCMASGTYMLCNQSSSCTGTACATLGPTRSPSSIISTPSFPGMASNIASIMDKKFDDGMPLTGNIVSSKGWNNAGVWGSSDGVSVDSSICNDATTSTNFQGAKYSTSKDVRKGCIVAFKVFQ